MQHVEREEILGSVPFLFPRHMVKVAFPCLLMSEQVGHVSTLHSFSAPVSPYTFPSLFPSGPM